MRCYRSPLANNEVTWTYVKDSSISSGSDAGWVDTISLASVTGEPVIVSPSDALATLLAPFTYEIISIDPAATLNAIGLPPGLSFDGDRTISGTPEEAGTFEITLSADNGQTFNKPLTLTIVAPIGPAVEQPNREWIPGGDGFWFPQVDNSVEGGDAARAGDIDDDGSSTVSIEVTGPDVIAFWWKVSSEQNYDFLSFLLDGELVREISGEVDWRREVFSIPSGTHTLTWFYNKDGSESAGQDTGWLDHVTLASSSPLPLITSPSSTVAFIGEPLYFQVTAENSPQTFGSNELPAGLEIDAETGVISGQIVPAGTQTFIVWAENNSGRSEIELTVTQTALDVAIPPAIEQPLLPISNDPIAPWSVNAQRAFAGGTSAVSGLVFDGESTTMTAQVVGPGSASFHWSVSSEGDFDFLVFRLDGIFVDEISGEVGWTPVEFDLAPGLRQLEWTYEKDSSDFLGFDRGWVDNFQLSGYAAYANANGLRLSRALPSLDPDGDRFASLLEFVFGTHPDDAAEIPSISVEPGATETIISFVGTSDLGDVSITLQHSSDLRGSWTDLALVPQITPAGPGRATYRFTAPREADSDADYYRLKASTDS